MWWSDDDGDHDDVDDDADADDDDAAADDDVGSIYWRKVTKNEDVEQRWNTWTTKCSSKGKVDDW